MNFQKKKYIYILVKLVKVKFPQMCVKNDTKIHFEM